MAEHIISIENAKENLLSCALFLTGNINSVESRAAAVEEVASHIIAQGNVDLAAELADSLEDPFVRNRLLTNVVAKCAEIGDDEYAFQLVDAIDEYGIQSRAKEVIALKMAERGEFDKALEIANNLDHSSDAFAGIATYQLQKSSEAEALNTLEKISFPGSKVKALLSAASHSFNNEQPEKVTQFLDKARLVSGEVEFIQEKIGLLMEIAIHFIRSKNFGKAIEVLKETLGIIETIDGVQKDNLLVNVAVGFLKAEDVELADATLDLVVDKTQISSCLLAFSQEFSNDGDAEEALETLEESYAILKSQGETEIRDSKQRYSLFASIAIQFAQLQKFERAIEVAQENAYSDQKNLALSNIAQIAVFKENDDYADQAIKAIKEESSRLNALVGLSDAKETVKKRDESLDLLNNASQLVDTVEQLIVRTEVENDLALRFNKIGETEKSREMASRSLQTIEEIKGDENRSYALAQLSDVYNKLEFEVSEEDKNVLDSMIKTSEFS